MQIGLMPRKDSARKLLLNGLKRQGKNMFPTSRPWIRMLKLHFQWPGLAKTNPPTASISPENTQKNGTINNRYVVLSGMVFFYCRKNGSDRIWKHHYVRYLTTTER